MARISHSVETITPQRARKYLERNTKNRRVRPKIVSRYALAMQQGQWSLTGEPILFDTEGNLLDGQHRLHACIESSCSFRTVVIRGIQQDTFADINTGSSRNPGDALYLAGYSKSKMCAAAIKVIHNMEIMEENPDVRSLRGRDITRQDLLAFMQEHEEEMIEATHVIEGEGRSILRPPSVFVALRFRFGQSNEMRAQEFFDKLSTGVDLSADDPIYKLRHYLIKELGQKLHKRTLEWKVAVTIKCWNAWLRGKSMKQLKFHDEEAWPRIYQRMKPRRRRRSQKTG